MTFTSDDLALFDECSRRFVWSKEWSTGLTLPVALYKALEVGLLAGAGAAAREHFLALCARPGLSISAWNLYAICVHHAALAEIIVDYLTGDGPWQRAEGVRIDSHTYQPLSYLLGDGRLRRAILCTRWDSLREQEERFGWRTVGDIAATGRPMIINAISIGPLVKGFRHSPWARGYFHPRNGGLRVKRAEGQEPEFKGDWKRRFREDTEITTRDWLKVMQGDKAFEDCVHTVNVPEALGIDFPKSLHALASADPNSTRRSACFRYSPCPFVPVCLENQSIAQTGYRRLP